MNRSRAERFIVFSYFVALLILLAGCANQVRTSNIQVQGSSVAGWVTFTFLPDQTPATAATGTWRALLAQDILVALNGKRYRYFVNRRTDMLIAYHVTLNGNEPISTLMSYSGYKYGPIPPIQIDPAKIQDPKRRGIVPPGTIVIDIIDARRRQLIWRGWSITGLESAPQTIKQRLQIKAAVDSILSKFPERTRR
jgi:hypothetical protein